MAGVVRRRRRRRGAAARPLPDAADAAARPRAPRRRAVADQHRLRQHDPDGPRAVVPGRRGGRARLPSLDPVERRHHGAPRAAAGDRRGRPHLLLRLIGDALRGRVQPLLPGQGPPGWGRPGLHPGARLPRRLRPRLPGGAAGRGPARRLPPGALARRSGPRAAVLPAPAADARLLGVPHRLDGARPDERDHAGPVQPVPGRPRVQRHERPARLGVPRRRRDGRAGVPRPDPHRRGRGPGQPDLRRQLQPAAARRPGPRQREDHPGAGVVLPRRGLERHQGDLGPGVGRAAARRPRRRAGQPHEHDPGRRLPDLQGQRRRVRPRALLRPRPADEGAGRADERRRRSGTSSAAGTTTARSTRPTPPRRRTTASPRSSWPRRSRGTDWVRTSRAATPPTR